MSFLAPWLFVTGAVAALAVVALHLLTTRRPPAAPLPTARFIPETETRAVARASRPTDLLLLALRALAVLAVGAAFARPMLDAPGPSVRAVVAVEWSRDVAEPEALRATVRAALGEGDALVLFDTAARAVSVEEFDTLAPPSAALRGDGISAMFVVARDEAARIARGADSVRLVVHAAVSPEDLDAASPSLRATWPGRVELVPALATAPSAVRVDAQVIGAEPDDPLEPAVQAFSAQRQSLAAADPEARAASASPRSVRVVRSAATAADSLWLLDEPGRALVLWPSTGEHVESPDAVQSSVRGTSRGGRSGAPTLVAPLARIPIADAALAESGEAGLQIVARWRDGEPAAVERELTGAACIRTVGVGIPVAGDITLRAPFTHFLAAMLAPCGGSSSAVLPDSALAWLTAPGPLASATALAVGAEGPSPLAVWLLLIALALALVEQFVRRRPARGVA